MKYLLFALMFLMACRKQKVQVELNGFKIAPTLYRDLSDTLACCIDWKDSTTSIRVIECSIGSTIIFEWKIGNAPSKYKSFFIYDNGVSPASGVYNGKYLFSEDGKTWVLKIDK